MYSFICISEFDDEHPLNEASLVPDFPQNGYPMPLKLKLTPKSKRYSLPTGIVNLEIFAMIYNCDNCDG